MPKTIEILGVTYRVETKELPNPKDYGESDGYERTITISPRDTETMKATLLHEIVHQVLHVSGLTHVLDSVAEDKFEEAVVTALEHGLLPYFKMPR